MRRRSLVPAGVTGVGEGQALGRLVRRTWAQARRAAAISHGIGSAWTWAGFALAFWNTSRTTLWACLGSGTRRRTYLLHLPRISLPGEGLRTQPVGLGCGWGQSSVPGSAGVMRGVGVGGGPLGACGGDVASLPVSLG